MERALVIWQELGLPPLKLKEPSYGCEMEYWPKESAQDAERAVKGEYYRTNFHLDLKNLAKDQISPATLKGNYLVSWFTDV